MNEIHFEYCSGTAADMHRASLQLRIDVSRGGILILEESESEEEQSVPDLLFWRCKWISSIDGCS